MRQQNNGRRHKIADQIAEISNGNFNGNIINKNTVIDSSGPDGDKGFSFAIK